MRMTISKDGHFQETPTGVRVVQPLRLIEDSVSSAERLMPNVKLTAAAVYCKLKSVASMGEPASHEIEGEGWKQTQDSTQEIAVIRSCEW